MKQNKKIVVIIITIMTMLLTSIPAFGYTDTSTNGIDFSNQPIPYIPYDNIAYGNAGLLIWRTTDTSCYLSCQTTDRDVYTFYARDKSGNDGVAVCALSGAAYTYTRFNNSNNSMVNKIQRTLSSTSNGYYYETTGFPYYDSAATFIPIFDTFSGGIAALNEWKNEQLNPPSPSPVPTGHSVTYPVPYGNAIIFDITGLEGRGTIIATANNPTFSFYSSVSGGHFTTLPSTITYPMSGLVQYSWDGSGRTDTQGRYNYFSTAFNYDATDISDNSYYIVVNPPFTAGLTTDYVLNSEITVSMAQVNSFQVVPLNTQVSYGGQQTSTQDGEGGTGVYDPDTGNWIVTDGNGDPYAPVAGGTDQPEAPTMTIHDYLQNIANTIKGFFSGAVGAISTLIASGSAFMRQLNSLYSWLPAPVYSVLCAALILVITIGVIKVFL